MGRGRFLAVPDGTQCDGSFVTLALGEERADRLAAIFAEDEASPTTGSEDSMAAKKEAKAKKEAAAPKVSTRLKDSRLPKAGTVIEKEFDGKKHKVTFLGDEGIRYGGEVYKSLSGVAAAITGRDIISGYDFFGVELGLRKVKEPKAKKEAKPKAAAKKKAAKGKGAAAAEPAAEAATA